jgi:O-antigen ligase
VIKLLDYIYFNLGIQTYSLAKYRMMINEGIAESSSGRDQIYRSIWELIKQKPFIGHGIGILQSTSGYTAHNIFLQILVESGILGLLIWVFIWIYCFNKYNKISKSDKDGLYKVVTLIVSIAMGRLLISSDMWLRPEYWFAISMLINFKWESRCLQKYNKLTSNELTLNE